MIDETKHIDLRNDCVVQQSDCMLYILLIIRSERQVNFHRKTILLISFFHFNNIKL